MTDRERALLERQVELLEAISAKLEAGAASSVELKTSTRGVDITTKAYAGSAIRPVGDAAIDEYFRIFHEIEQRLMGRSAA